MDFGEFWLKYSENNNLSQSCSSSDSAVAKKKTKIKLLFDFFDTNHDKNLDKNEMQAFISLKNNYAKREGLNSLFSANEQELLLSEQKDKKNKSLADNGISRKDLIEFLNIVSETLTGKKINTVKPLTEDQKETLKYLERITDNAVDMVESNEENEGFLAKTVNMYNEIFRKKYAKSTATQNISQSLSDIQKLSVSNNFTQDFKKLRGVEYNQENIDDCMQRAEVYARAKTSYDMINMVKSELGVTTNGTVKAHMRPQEATKAIIKALQMCGINDLKTMNEILANLENKFKNNPTFTKYGKNLKLEKDSNDSWVINRTPTLGGREPATQEQLNIIAQELCIMLDKAYATAIGVEYNPNASEKEISKLNEQAVNKYKAEYETSFTKAYGGKDAQILAEKFIEKEQAGVANIKMGLSIASMALMLTPEGLIAKGTGCLLKGADAVTVAAKTNKAVKVFKGAKTTVAASMVLHPIDFLDKWSSKGISKAEFDEWWKSCAESAVFMGVGMGVSKAAENLACAFKTKALINTLQKS